MAMYIRVKRSKTTYFIQCDPTETTLDIKQKLHTLIDQPVNDQHLILLNTGEILEDSKTLADQKVENDVVVALTLRKAENRKLHLTAIVHHAKRIRSRKHTLYCIIQSCHILCHCTANMQVSTSILISFPFRLPDDNEFEDVNIVQPNDFYQSRDADNGNW